MTDAVKKLIEKAEAGEQTEEIRAAVEKLTALGEEAKGSTAEFRDLRELVDERDKDTSPTPPPQPKAKTPKKLKYKGIKQIGTLWYHESDNYAKGYETADKCAEAYN